MNKQTKITPEILQRIREKYANKGYDEYALFEVIKADEPKQEKE